MKLVERTGAGLLCIYVLQKLENRRPFLQRRYKLEKVDRGSDRDTAPCSDSPTSSSDSPTGASCRMLDTEAESRQPFSAIAEPLD